MDSKYLVKYGSGVCYRLKSSELQNAQEPFWMLGKADHAQKVIFLLDLSPNSPSALTNGLDLLGTFTRDPPKGSESAFVGVGSQDNSPAFYLGPTQLQSKDCGPLLLKDFYQTFSCLRLEGKFKVSFTLNKGEVPESEIEVLKKTFSEQLNSSFLVTDNLKIRLDNEKSKAVNSMKDSSQALIGTVLPSVIPLKICFGGRGEDGDGGAVSPRLELQCNPHLNIKEVGLDVLLYVSNSEPLHNVAQQIKAEISAQYNLLLETAKAHPKYSKIHTYHFGLGILDRVISAIYPIDPIATNEDYLVHQREFYHEVYVLPRRPLLRIVSALTFSPTPTRSARLSDVHLNIPPPAKGKEYLVQGSYDYYHYNQDSFNDDGWGCAYRSLQTIQSWYQKANLTTQPIQNHLEIQKFLYALGQKPKNFVGSKEWIGSIEIQTILRGYMGIVSKIEHVQKGNQMADHVSVLIDHFERQGTPIMIGGGQLAYTLLGVHVNQDTGRVMYLILDPHYVGKEDLQVIHKKGWCGWKDGSLFKDKYFYNLCLPQAHNPSASGV